MTDLLSSLRPDHGGEQGGRRPDWSWLPDAADAPTDAQLARHRAETDRLLADHGVTYGADGADAGPRSWRLDPVPVIVDEHEWSTLDAGLVERAELLDAILRDVYGERRLLTDALLPPELVLAHPGFLRAVDGLRLPSERELVLTATDLARDTSGSWVVVADRTQAPSGAGYAMEDRRVVAQVLAGVYRQASIQRIGPFFHALRLALQEVAPPGASSPRVVLLTSGPFSETAFDQGYLSSMLGFPLVEGSDLLVREGRVWMQGLDALEPVDVILRRVDADFCDPLELRTDSRLGVPGLVRAVRAGTVSVVNPLGSSVLENPGLLTFLPRLARAVLGRDLALPSPPTYWCGEDRALSHVLARLEHLVIKPTARGPRVGTVLGWTLSRGEREHLAARIAANPGAWVGQEPVSERSSRTRGVEPPDAGAQDVEPGTAVLRAFAVAHRGAYQVMTGGLARVAPDAARQVVSSALGAVAKDVWVLSSGTGAATDTWVIGDDDAGRRRVVSGISPRTAENLFWMGRYAERAGDTVRTLRAVVDRWNDYHHSPASVGGRALAALLAATGAAPPRSWSPIPDAGAADGGAGVDADGGASASAGAGAGGRAGADAGASVLATSGPPSDLRTLLLDRDRPDTVAWSVRALADAAAAVRDQLSTDTWLPIASLERALRDERRVVAAAVTVPPATGSTTPTVTTIGAGTGADTGTGAGTGTRRTEAAETAGMQPVLDRMLEALLALAGIGAESMVRDAGWRFLDAGRRIERAQYVVDTLAATLVETRTAGVDALVLESVLIANESVITYRRRNQGRASVATVLDLLLTDTTNPRSLGYQLDRLREDLAAVPVTRRSTDVRDRLLQDVADVITELDTATVAGALSDTGRRERLAEVLESVRWRLRAATDEIARLHFVHPAPSRTLADTWGVESSTGDADDQDEHDEAEA